MMGSDLRPDLLGDIFYAQVQFREDRADVTGSELRDVGGMVRFAVEDRVSEFLRIKIGIEIDLVF